MSLPFHFEKKNQHPGHVYPRMSSCRRNLTMCPALRNSEVSIDVFSTQHALFFNPCPRCWSCHSRCCRTWCPTICSWQSVRGPTRWPCCGTCDQLGCGRLVTVTTSCCLAQGDGAFGSWIIKRNGTINIDVGQSNHVAKGGKYQQFYKFRRSSYRSAVSHDF